MDQYLLKRTLVRLFLDQQCACRPGTIGHDHAPRWCSASCGAPKQRFGIFRTEVSECIIWHVQGSDKRADIPVMTMRHILERHFGVCSDSVTLWQHEFDKLLRFPPLSPRVIVQLGLNPSRIPITHKLYQTTYLPRGWGALDGLADCAAPEDRQLCAHAGYQDWHPAWTRGPQGINTRPVGPVGRGSHEPCEYRDCLCKHGGWPDNGTAHILGVGFRFDMSLSQFMGLSLFPGPTKGDDCGRHAIRHRWVCSRGQADCSGWLCASSLVTPFISR
jgi:hypothetical protein